MTDKRTSPRGLGTSSKGGQKVMGWGHWPGEEDVTGFQHATSTLRNLTTPGRTWELGSSAPPKAHQVPGIKEHPYPSGQGGRTNLNITKRFYFQETDEWAMPASLLTQTPLGSRAVFDGYGSWTRSNLFSLQNKPKQKFMSFWGFAQLFTTTEYSWDSEDWLCDLYNLSHSILIRTLDNATLTFNLQKSKW